MPIQTNSEHLTFSESIKLCITPAVFFLINGVAINTFKFFESSTNLYYIFLSLFPIFIVYKIIRKGLPPHIIRKYLPILLICACYAVIHHLIYKSAVGADSLAYFTRPFYTFYTSNTFSFYEQPFVTFGQQPLPNYWLPYNSEYIFTALGSLFDASFIVISSAMHITSNFLLAIALFSIILRYTKIVPGSALLVIFLLLLYVSLSNTRDLTATSIFRGFENKGLIFGYFYWSIVGFFIVPTNKTLGLITSIISAIIFGFGSFAVSGNALFLILPAISLVFSRVFIDRSFTIVFSSIAFISALLIGTMLYKLFETTDVYDVVSNNLTPRAARSYDAQSLDFKQSWLLWGLTIALLITTAYKNLQLAIQLSVFCLLSILFHSLWFFQLSNTIAPERMLNFWRGAILLNLFVPILFSSSFLLSTLPQKNQPKVAIISAFFILIISIKFMPMYRPFNPIKFPIHISEVAKSCKSKSIILANRTDAPQIAIANPSFQVLVGKEYFLNWQIANLPINSLDRIRALDVRNASLYISKDPVTQNYFQNSSGLINTIKNEKPDIILAPKERFTSEINILLSDYNKKTFKNKTVMSKNGICSFN